MYRCDVCRPTMEVHNAASRRASNEYDHVILLLLILLLLILLVLILLLLILLLLILLLLLEFQLSLIISSLQ